MSRPLVAVYAGCAVEDICIYIDQKAQADGAVQNTRELNFLGGSASNAARAFATLADKSNDLSSTTFYSSFGKHIGSGAGSEYLALGINMRDCAPDNDYLMRRNRIVISPEGERLKIGDSTPERNQWPEDQIPFPEHLQEDLEHHLEHAEIVGLGTRYPLITSHIAKEAKRIGAKQGRHIPVRLDAGAWRPYMPELIELSDIIIASHEFIPDGAGERISAENIIEYMRENSDAHDIAVTRGMNKTLLWSGGQMTEIPVPHEVRHNPLRQHFTLTVRDTNAAGDIHKGAFDFYLLRSDGDVAWALKCANKVASRSVFQYGPQAALNDIHRLYRYNNAPKSDLVEPHV